MNPYKEIIENLLEQAGITIEGQKPYDIRVYHPDFYRRILKDGARGLGESYVEGWWECKRLDRFFNRVFDYQVEQQANQQVRLWSLELQDNLFMRFPGKEDLQACLHREAADYPFYQKMLGSFLLYQSGDWQGVSDINTAQEQRLLTVCEQLQLKKDETLLDMSCGWGGLAFYAAKHYGVKVVGVTQSQQQHAYATKLCKGLPITIVLKDQREIKGVFDKIVSLQQYDDGGVMNYKAFMETVDFKLKRTGIGVFDLFSSGKSGNNQSALLNDFVLPKHRPLRRLAQTIGLVEKHFVLKKWSI
ncbi:MAG: hypothetical protein CVU03_02150 [Bacteroidetes bacterium HGW-Bacteroidetes-2]|jgi:cyclopropane-fatty-acyl-phospholipid synthase|nr:MAG: hypothetical protein CVU13_06165 [Bacteroidetes bacterium HGW-Bacteroidetes-8]PKP26699.1 MAG: hypothetical protein CVU03_02150 [Bacteroidetes bacterium HGW-Bacteroidetes-2]